MGTTTTKVPETTILPATVNWAYPDLGNDYMGKKEVWREVSEDFQEQALNSVPPIYVTGGFMVSEPYHFDDLGRSVYAAFVTIGKRHFAKLSTRAQLPEHLQALHAALQKAA